MGERIQLRLLKRGICDFALLAWQRGPTFSRTLTSVIVTLILHCPGGGGSRKETHNFQLTYKTNAVQEGKWHRTDWYLQVSRGGTFPCAMTLLSPSLKLLPRLDLSITGTVFDHHLFSWGFHRHSSECQLMTGMLDVPFWRCYELMAGQNQTAWCLLAN